MIRHVILWQWKDGLTEAEKETIGNEIKEKLEALAGVVPGLKEIRVCVSPMASSNADIYLDSVVEDAAALKVYAEHPAHLAVKDGLIVPNVKTRLCMDFEI